MIERSINFHEALNRSWDRSPFYNTFLFVTLDIPTINAIHMSQGRFSHYDFASPVKGLGSGDETIPGFSSTQITPGKMHAHVFDRTNPGATKGWNIKHQNLAIDPIVLQKVLDIINSQGYAANLGPIPAWELRNKDQEEGPGPLVIGDPRRDIVIHLQTALVALGFNIGSPKPDGILGSTTVEAVKTFQTSNTDFKSSKLVADGISGPLTVDAINRALIGKWYGQTDYFTPNILVIHYDKLKAGAAIPIQPLPGKPAKMF